MNTHGPHPKGQEDKRNHHVLAGLSPDLQHDMHELSKEHAHLHSENAENQTHTRYEHAEVDRTIQNPTSTPLSISDIIESSNKMSIFPTQEQETPMTNEEAVTQIDLSHLSEADAEAIRQIFRDFPSILGKHTWNLPPTDHVTAHIELNESK